MHSEELLGPWLAPLRKQIPDLDAVDVHTRVGLADPAALLATEQEPPRVARARQRARRRVPVEGADGYRDPNQRVLELVRHSARRVQAFARLDPADDLVVAATVARTPAVARPPSQRSDERVAVAVVQRPRQFVVQCLEPSSATARAAVLGW
jgi:hypothetical protein